MNKQLRRYSLSLEVKAPFFFPSLAFGAFGYDKIAHRTSDDRALIPRSQVRGLLLHGLQALRAAGHEDACVLIEAFGQAGDDANPSLRDQATVPAARIKAPGRRSEISVGDMVCNLVESGASHPPAPRVKIDPRTGAADPGHLMEIEQLAPAGATRKFVADVWVYSETDVAPLLKRAMTYHDSIGALKSVGFGQTGQCCCTEEEITPIVASAAPKKASRAIWSFTLDRPYLVDALRAAENAYEGQVDIPGGALKGLLAAHLETRGELSSVSTFLTETNFGFARPVGAWPAFPHSAAYDKNRDAIIDLAFCDPYDTESQILPLADWKAETPVFALRSAYMAARRFPNEPYKPSIETRVHVEIDDETQTVVNRKLYSSSALSVPKNGFAAILDFPSEPPAALLSALCGALAGLGRTDAVLLPQDLRFEDPFEPKAITQGRIALKLDSPALLLRDATAKDPLTAYADFWRQRLKHSTLLASYTEERLIGGYLAHRFGPSGYTPMLRTEAGSVFVLELSEKDINPLQNALKLGVCIDEFGDGTLVDWTTCPFVTTNGYGAISLHTKGGA